MLSLKPIHSLLYTLESAILKRQNSKKFSPKGFIFTITKCFSGLKYKPEDVKPNFQVYDATLEEKAKAWADICNVSASDPNTVTTIAIYEHSHPNS